jgi:hypothetical protein
MREVAVVSVAQTPIGPADAEVAVVSVAQTPIGPADA